jgi:hypothetical protein
VPNIKEPAIIQSAMPASVTILAMLTAKEPEHDGPAAVWWSSGWGIDVEVETVLAFLRWRLIEDAYCVELLRQRTYKLSVLFWFLKLG